MHELSIVSSVVESVTERLRDYPGAKVRSVRLRIGVLESVIKDSLEFCYGIATDETPLAGSRLEVVAVPVTIWCATCSQEAELEGVQSFRCPRCGEQSMDIRKGRELEIDSVEIDMPEDEETKQ